MPVRLAVEGSEADPLDRDVALEPLVPGTPDLAGTAPPDQLDQAVAVGNDGLQGWHGQVIPVSSRSKPRE